MATHAAFALQPRQTAAGRHRDGGSNSASGLVSTLVPAFILAVVVFGLFLLLRRRLSRVYMTRTYNTIVRKHELSPHSNQGFMGLIRNFKELPDEYVMEHNSLDGYLFLRFFKMLVVMCFAGCCITWPILFPVNATGGGEQSQLDVLSFSNISNPNRYYAHAIVAWIFLGGVFLLILRERLHFIALRQAYFFSTTQAQRLSSRTVLFMSIPKDIATQTGLKELLGSHVRKIWIAKDCKDLEDEVADRQQAYTKLEAAQVKMSTEANAARKKAAKENNRPEPDHTDPADSQRWVDPKKRPTHKLKFLIGKKVDTINWCRGEIPNMNKTVESHQKSLLKDQTKNLTSAFVEFDSQLAAQHAFQLVAKKPKKNMHPRYIGVAPNEVIWKNMGATYTTRKLKIIVFTIIVALLIIFFTPIAAFVGALGNINYLTTQVPFLSFINKIPSVILGVVTGLLPSLLLAILVALVPILMRFLAKLAGEPTLSAVELKTQGWYMAFQVIQVFLVTTFSSGAAAVAAQIVTQPSTAPSLLARNLPKASNFYLSYFILYGLGQASLKLLNIVPLLVIVVLGKILDKTPRKQYNRWLKLLGLGWGSEYPKWTNLGVIAIAYSCIAPLILGFATIGFALLYLAFRYEWLFVFGNKVDMKGEAYSKALNQLLIGVYLSAICMIGLFAIGTSGNVAGTGPLVLMIIFLVVLVIAHIMTAIAVKPLVHDLPLDMFSKDQHAARSDPPHDHTQETNLEAGMNSRVPNSPNSNTNVLEKDQFDINDLNRTDSDQHRKDKKNKENFLTKMIRRYTSKLYPEYKQFVTSFKAADDLIPEYAEEDYEMAYMNPALSDQPQMVWLAHDDCGVSEWSKIENEKVGIETSDDHAWFNEKNKVEWAHDKIEKVPIWEPPTRY